MKVVLLALSSRYIHLSAAPYYLASELSGYDACVLDHSVNETAESILSDILSHKPDVLGLSVYIWNISFLRTLVPKIKEALPKTHIVLGGPEVSYNVKETLRDFPYAFILSGEGEIPFRLFGEAARDNASFDTVPACSYIKNDGSMRSSDAYIGEGTPKSPLLSGYAEALKGRIAYIEASRGCPYTCAFCLSGRCGGVRFFNMESVKADILALSNVSRTLKFVDRTFNANRSRTLELLRFILSHYGKEIPEGTCFHFEIAGELLDEETLSLLETAPRGVFQTEIGIQSFHAPTLKAIHRSSKIERLVKNVRRLLEAGNIHVHIDLIAGLPEEDLSTFKESFRKAYALSPHMLQLGFLKLLHGAPMREKRELFPCEFTADPPYEVTSTPWISEEELLLIHTVEKALDRFYNSRRYTRTLSLYKDEPFGLFLALGERLDTEEKPITLDGEISLIYQLFKELGIDENALRDALLLDFLSTNSSRLTPTVLRREDARLKRVKQDLAVRFPVQNGVRRAVALLSGERVAFVDYIQKDSVSQSYPVRVFPLSEILT